jgi:hypothetical protein
MKKSRVLPHLLLALSLAGGAGVSAQEDPEVVFKPISISGQFDVGQVVKGQLHVQEVQQPGTELRGNFFQRTGVWITQEATVRERLRLTMGVGGLFWYALPSTTDPSSKLTQFGPGISQAQAVYTWGDLEYPAASLQMGYFPYKYNPDAKNLGEYLLRSGTYPGYVVSGGWNMISSAAYMVQGLRLNVPFGDMFEMDLLLPMEHDIPPMYGLSPTVVLTSRPLAGIEIGAGAACNHCIPVKPSLESPSHPDNRVIKSATVTVDTVTLPGETLYSYAYTYDTGAYYTFQGVKVMGRVSVDPKAFVPMPFLGPEDLKLYSEIALLGLKNYSYLYEKRTERMPILFGLNLPTFRFLDVLSFELEYYNSKFPNSLSGPLKDQLPVWDLLGGSGQEDAALVDAYEKSIKEDNWKWSVYAKKEVTKGLQLYAQVASDHIRTFQYNLGPQPISVPMTNGNGSEWYYIVRLQFGI